MSCGTFKRILCLEEPALQFVGVMNWSWTPRKSHVFTKLDGQSGLAFESVVASS